MKNSAIENANLIYICGKNATIDWQSIKFPEFQTFTVAVQRLLNSVGELDENDYWLTLIRKIRRFRFNAIAAPLSEMDLQAQLNELISHLIVEKERFSYSNPDAAEHFSQLLALS